MTFRPRDILDQGKGILRLSPTWVPRKLFIPGGRLKLDSRDLYAMGAHRGGINTRWLSSTTKADNGPLAAVDEGLSYVVYGQSENYQKILLREMVTELGADLIGENLWGTYHRWPILSKFFDFRGSLPHHLHLMPEHAALVSLESKPEGYYFPPQLNAYQGDFPFTFFGLEPGTTKEQVRHCLEIWNQGDNHITSLSKAYRLEPGTGWVLPAGTLHGPGSLVTYEPQWGSDVQAVFQSVVNSVPLDWNSVVRDVPEEKRNDLDYLVSLLNWEINLTPNFKEKYFRDPVPVKSIEIMEEEGYREYWISYGSEFFSAKELTVLPGRTANIFDTGPYGLVIIQGHGVMGCWHIESPSVIRYGQETSDEFFVSEQAARAGVHIKNESFSEPLVMLKHFGPLSRVPMSVSVNKNDE
jgi:hypothetical protein